jgi:hypothetical protein
MSEIIRVVSAGLGGDLPEPVTVHGRPLGGVQAIWKFPNGYGASVVHGFGTYGVELAVLDADGNLTYSTPITDDVVGHIESVEELRDLLRRIRDLNA